MILVEHGSTDSVFSRTILLSQAWSHRVKQEFHNESTPGYNVDPTDHVYLRAPHTQQAPNKLIHTMV